MHKNKTSCCALGHLSGLNNNTSYEELKEKLSVLKEQAKKEYRISDNSGEGQTSVFTIVTPGEKVLENTLKSIGFQEIHNFKRRNGYPQTGNLKMFIYNLID